MNEIDFSDSSHISQKSLALAISQLQTRDVDLDSYVHNM